MRYTVHSFHETKMDVPAVTAQGHKITGHMPVVIVELVPDEDHGRSLTHVEFTATLEELAAARAAFPIGGKVDMTLTPVKGESA